MIHEHPVVGQDLHHGCGQVVDGGSEAEGGAGDCGEMVGYVDDGAYGYAHSDPAVLTHVLSKEVQFA